MLEVFPGCERVVYRHGLLALHLLIIHNANIQVIKEMIVAFPQATQMKDAYGKLPLYYTENHKQRDLVAQALVQMMPFV